VRLRRLEIFKNVEKQGAFSKAWTANQTGEAVVIPIVSIAPITEGDRRHFVSGQVISFIDPRLMIC